MRRINEDAVVTIVSGHGANVNGFSEGDPSVPRQGTQLSADWHNQIQEEIASVIDEAGLTFDGSLQQLLAAIRIVALDTSGGAGQNVQLAKNFLNTITVTAVATANGTAVTATGLGSGAGVRANGGPGSTSNGGVGIFAIGGAPITGAGHKGGTAVLAAGGNATGSASDAGDGGSISGGGFNAVVSGNTTGAAGVGSTITGGTITADANGRRGGAGLVVAGGQGQAGYGKAIDAQHGDVHIADNLVVDTQITATGAINANGGITLAAPTTVASMPGGFKNSFADGSPLSGGYVPKAWVDAQGMKHIVGEIGGTGTTGTVAFTLDTPFRPAAFFSVTAINGAGGTAQLDFSSNGDVIVRFTAGSVNVHIPPMTYL